MPGIAERPRGIEIPEENSVTTQIHFSKADQRGDQEVLNRQLDKQYELETNAQERWDKLIGLFGTDKARNRFLGLCIQYKEEYGKSPTKKHSIHIEGSSSSPDSKRAAIHNEIMYTIGRLTLGRTFKGKDREFFKWAMDRDNISGLLKTIHIA